jgi:hypothetical protein
MTVLGSISAAITVALGFGDLAAVFGESEPIVRFALTTIGGALGFALDKTNPGNG